MSVLKEELKSWLNPLNTLMNSTDRNFYHGTPMILAEEFVSDVAHQLYDYKVFCFNGKPHCFYVQTAAKNSKITFYNLKWEKLNVQYGNHEVTDIPVPSHFNEMLEIAEILSAGFPFLRVDFFDTEKKLYVGELTFGPGGGWTKYKPESFNKELGDLFILPR